MLVLVRALTERLGAVSYNPNFPALFSLQCIVGGCPLMYCEPVDLPHRCMRWLLRMGGKVPR
jgi:hypothetical protein